MKKRLVGILLASILGLSACQSAGGVSSTASEKIKIAVAAPMTGDNSEYGIGFYNAAVLMVNEWNENGGVLGRQIEIVQYDDKNTPEEATTIAQKIISDKNIVGVIGHFASGVSMTAAPIYQENKVIEISPSASHLDYSSIGDYIFRNNSIISKESATSVDIAVNDFGKKNVGIISIMTDWGTNSSKVIKEIIDTETDAKVVAHEEIIEGSDDYSSVITKLNEAGADVIIACGMYNLVAPLAKQYKQINPDIEIVGFSNSYSQQLLELGGETVNGVSFPVSFFAESTDPEIVEYVEKFEKEYNQKPSSLTSQAYDSVGLLLTAIEKAGTTDAEKVKDALYELEYKGVTGNIKFDENGDVDKEFVKVTIKDGKFVSME